MKAILLALTLLSIPALAAPPVVIDPSTGKYLGTLSANPYLHDATSNPHGIYGSPHSAESINNPHGVYGSPYSPDSPNNPYAVSDGLGGLKD